MSTLQALCEAAEMSVELPVSTNQSPASSSTQLSKVDNTGAPSHHSAHFPKGHMPATMGAAYPASVQTNFASAVPPMAFKADARDTDSPTFAATERRDASSPIIHNYHHPQISMLNTMALDAPKSVAANTKGASGNKGGNGKPTRKRGWVKKSWEERLMELKAYKAVNGDCNVPTLSKTNPSLGHWVHDQRKQYRLWESGKSASMNADRIRQLEAVGFKWALQRHTQMKSWSERYKELVTFKTTMGHSNVPIRWRENPSLGQWVSTQRQEYGNFINGKKSNITDARIEALEKIGFVWCLRDTAKMAPRKSWDMHFRSLQEFKNVNGHCDVRVRSKHHPTGSLGRWVEKQRSQYSLFSEGKSCKITQSQVEKLDSIGFKWRIRNDKKTPTKTNNANTTNNTTAAASGSAVTTSATPPKNESFTL